MTYCVEQTRLLAKAGRELAASLLPEPFNLWHSDHSTGIQMTIVTKVDALTVWRGSVWHSSMYEFNDRNHTPGLQPDFKFASSCIAKYFEDVARAVAERDAARETERQRRALAEELRRQGSIAAVRAQIEGA